MIADLTSCLPANDDGPSRWWQRGYRYEARIDDYCPDSGISLEHLIRCPDGAILRMPYDPRHEADAEVFAAWLDLGMPDPSFFGEDRHWFDFDDIMAMLDVVREWAMDPTDKVKVQVMMALAE